MIAKQVTEMDLFTIDREEEYRYVECEGGVKVIGYSGCRQYVEIPEELDGKKVVELDVHERGCTEKVHRRYVLLPNTISCVNSGFTDGCYTDTGWVTGIYLKEDNPHFIMEQGILYSKDKKILYFIFDWYKDVVVIPDGVEEIRECALMRQWGRKLHLPSSVKKIGSDVFGGAWYSVIEISDQVEEIGNDIAYQVSVSGNNRFYKEENGCIYTLDGKILVQSADRNRYISQIIIPDTVEEIRPYAFSGMDIKKLDLGKGVKKIGEGAFEDAQVKTIRIPAQLEELSDKAFGYSKCNLVKVEKSNRRFSSDGICFFSVSENGEKRLLKCFKEEEEYDVPEGVTSIAPKAFFSCSSLKRISLPKSLKAFDGSCLPYPSNITKIEIPQNVVELNIRCGKITYEIAKENRNFFCENGIIYHRVGEELEIIVAQDVSGELKLKEGVTRIKKFAFSGCGNITKVVCNPELRVIEKNAFSSGGYSPIREISLNEGIEFIGHKVFAGSKIKKVFLPSTLRYLSVSAFYMCEKAEFQADKGNPYYTAVDGALYNKDMTELLFVPKKRVFKQFAVPEGVTEIGSAFAGCKKVEEIILPKSLQRIWSGALQCSAKDIYFEGDVKYFDESGMDFMEEVRIHTNRGTGAEQYVQEIKGVYNTKLQLLLNDCEEGSGLSKECEELLNDSEINSVKEKESEENMKIPEQIESTPVTVGDTDQITMSVSEEQEEKEALEYLDYWPNSDGTVSVKFRYFWREVKSDLRIPKKIQGMPVTKLGGFSNLYDEVESIYVPESILVMEDLCYLKKRESLKKIEVAENNPNYWSDGKALYTKDKSILLRMFDYQTEEYEICLETKEIGKEAFKECSGLKKIFLPEKLNVIRELAFCKCSGLEDIVGFEKVQKVGKDALSSTLYYEKEGVLINGTVLYRYNAVGEKTYEIPEKITEIEANAFKMMSDEKEDDLEKIVIPGSVHVIGEEAFSGRKKLKSVLISEGVERIEKGAFLHCKNLEKLRIPASVKEISIEAFPLTKFFYGYAPLNPVLSEIIVEEQNPYYCSIEGVLYSKDKKTLLRCPENYNKTEYVVPEGVETIGEYAFSNNMAVKRILLPETVKTISQYAFLGSGLEEIFTIGDENSEKGVKRKVKVEKIESGAFKNCFKLQNIALEGTKIIESYAFNFCKITSLTLSEGLEEIGDKAFAECNLKEVTVPKTVVRTGYESFSGCPEITIYDTIDPWAKPCTKHLDNINGSPNSKVGFIGIGEARAMWDCAANHEWLDYEIIVRAADTEKIKYKVWMGAEKRQRMYYCTLSSSWGRNASFNFRAVDRIFTEIKGTRDKIKIALNRLRYPEMLSEESKKTYLSYLSRSAKELVMMCIDKGDLESLLFCEPYELIKKNHMDVLLEYATEKKATEFSAYLMEYKNKKFGGDVEKVKLPSLSVKMESPWAVSKTDSGKVGRYKGNETEIEFPTEIKGKKMTGIANTTSKVPDNYKNLVSVVLPEGYTTIGDYAFFGCTNLEKIILPGTLEFIGRRAFYGCSKLKEVIMPENLKIIGEYSFAGCSNLTNVKFSKKIETIPRYAFYGCDAWKEIVLPENVRWLEEGCLEIYGVEKVIVQRTEKLRSTGRCFGSVKTMYAAPGVIKGGYGITHKMIKPLEALGNNSFVEEEFFSFDAVDKIEFEGKIFVLTGFEGEEKEKITRLIESEGGEIKESTVVKTNYLIVPEEYEYKTTKYNKALELKKRGNEIFIIGAKQFYELVKNRK